MQRQTLALFTALIISFAAPASLAQDPDSLRIAKVPASTQIELSWTDATPDTYCVERSMMPSRPLGFLDQTMNLTYRDDAPAAALWYYEVNEAPGGSCVMAEPCLPAGMLSCGVGPVAGNTAAMGGTNVLVDYAGCGQTGLTGSEFAFEITSSFDGQMMVRLSTAVADLRVAVIEDTGAGCDPGSCVGFASDQVTFDVRAGGTYYAIVDGLAGASGDFDIELLCAGGCQPNAAVLDCGGSVMATSDGLGSTDGLDFYEPCFVLDATGSEQVYSFTAPADGMVTATLSTAVGGLDLMVLEDLTGGCAADSCIAAEDSEVTWSATAGTTYYLVVDGRLDASGDFTLDVSCPVGGCTPLSTTSCGSTEMSNNGGAGSSDLFDSYAPCGAMDTSGPEVAYEFVAASSGAVDLALSGLSADLDLFVLQDGGAGCEAMDCIAGGSDALQFDATIGETYYLVVDGVAGAVSDFTLDVSCAPVLNDCEPVDGLVCGFPAFGRNDDGGSTDNIDSYPCAPGDFSGSEYTYEFQAAGDGMVTLSIGTTPDVDLFLLDASGGACEPAACIAYGEDEISFMATAGESYYVVVEGLSGGGGPYVLTTDCDFPPGQCSPVRSIGCGEQHFNNNGNPAGSTVANDSYSCAPGRDMSGPEYAYQLVAPPGQDTRVQAILENQSGDVDVFILENMGVGCDPGTCVAWGDDSVFFDALAGRQYYIVVDGPGGNTGDYRLRLECSPAPGDCLAMTPIACGETIAGQANDQAGSTDGIDQYDACAILNPPDVSGPEVAYSFTAAADGMVDVNLTNVPNGPLAVYVIEETGNGCSPDDCIGFGFDSHSFMATAGQTYYLVVEGYLGRVSAYDITVSCN